MHIIKWLKEGDTSIDYLVSKYLEEKSVIQKNNGYIKMYLQKYDEETKMWGNGLYSPKWISSTYTLLDLVNLEAAIESGMKINYESAKQITVKIDNNTTKKYLKIIIILLI